MPGQYAIYPSLRDKVVVVTGGAEGIGGATVEMFSHQGARAIILDISETSAHKLIEKIETDATQTTQIPTFYQCDVTDLTRLKTISEDIITTFGGVNILINNAACAGGKARAGTFAVDAETWQFNIDVNLRHQFFLTQYLAPSMKKLGGGSIINMGSISWRIPATGLPIYTTCKAAILGLTRTHAREFGKDRIRVNSVMPGSIATERQIAEVLTPEYKQETLDAQALKRVLVPEEVARVILFLASDDASAITGSSYCVDGGWVSDP
ncbi:putative galactose dehydrogenase GalD [Fulvia fulva]|uniref:Galactose dehydrogenase GalD n=1 Tax=Passalora fulva TaxID=5499 RepID=A0A9Q8PML1_PASFU|nr:putative galactose dehydrogenase GalD [Fulvia fulva]KAK4609326.1 putative galactose dehydrogenase GalD [Fulvia fulva]KAK4609624.1 putative galactose dehydrogenase GalD [Fulvia fulva]UJO25320.1 putative galactose dehydrogenase GalD [Fulvia fulva]WPV22419.1 putative galactose dehydrogenase GalD [Fulvia fulva]WPV37738.1 putative galactose dehydrogenase GalD [Fulvia fulva]